MKKTTLLLITLLYSVLLYAQTENNEYPNRTLLFNEEYFNQADLVFEGSYLKLVYTYNLLGNAKVEDTYAIRTYYVKKVFKGDQSLEGTTIHITRKGTYLGEENSPWIDLDGFHDRTIGSPFLKENGIPGVNSHSPAIFFSINSDFPDDENSAFFQYNKYNVLHTLFVYEDKAAGLNDLVFKNREDLYAYMKQFEGYIIPKQELLHEKQIEKSSRVSDSLMYELKGTPNN